MCRTNVDGLWAIGDVTAPPWLAHKASHEGVIAAEAIAQALGNKDVHPHAMDPRNIPGCTYCHPQVASVGLTEAKAKEAGYEVKAGTFPFIGNGKAIALGEAEGFIKTVFDAKTGELLGAHMVGAEVTELIQGYTVGKHARDRRGRAHEHRLPAPDAERDDARERARALTGGRCISSEWPVCEKGFDDAFDLGCARCCGSTERRPLPTPSSSPPTGCSMSSPAAWSRSRWSSSPTGASSPWSGAAGRGRTFRRARGGSICRG